MSQLAAMSPMSASALEERERELNQRAEEFNAVMQNVYGDVLGLVSEVKAGTAADWKKRLNNILNNNIVAFVQNYAGFKSIDDIPMKTQGLIIQVSEGSVIVMRTLDIKNDLTAISQSKVTYNIIFAGDISQVYVNEIMYASYDGDYQSPDYYQNNSYNMRDGIEYASVIAENVPQFMRVKSKSELRLFNGEIINEERSEKSTKRLTKSIQAIKTAAQRLSIPIPELGDNYNSLLQGLSVHTTRYVHDKPQLVALGRALGIEINEKNTKPVIAAKIADWAFTNEGNTNVQDIQQQGYVKATSALAPFLPGSPSTAQPAVSALSAILPGSPSTPQPAVSALTQSMAGLRVQQQPQVQMQVQQQPQNRLDPLMDEVLKMINRDGKINEDYILENYNDYFKKPTQDDIDNNTMIDILLNTLMIAANFMVRNGDGTVRLNVDGTQVIQYFRDDKSYYSYVDGKNYLIGTADQYGYSDYDLDITMNTINVIIPETGQIIISIM